MKTLQRYTPFLFVTILSWALMWVFMEYNAFFIQNIWYTIGLFIGVVVIIFLYYQIRFVEPLADINKEIALFVSGDSEETHITARGHSYTKFIGMFMAKVLDSLRGIRKDLLSGKTLKTEIDLAAEIQHNALGNTHQTIDNIRIVADAKSATEVGGDSFDIIDQEHNTYLYIGDVTGHGVASGFVMMIVNSLISAFSQLVENSATILAHTNRILKPRIKSNMMMTLLMLRWNKNKQKMYMCGAGHEYLIHYSTKKQKATTVKSGGAALGMVKNIDKLVKEQSIAFEKGDIIVMYSDGITEAKNAEGTLRYGLDRLVRTIEKAKQHSAQGIFNEITVDLSRFMGYKHVQEDDITLMVIEHIHADSPTDPAGQLLEGDFITEWNWN